MKYYVARGFGGHVEVALGEHHDNIRRSNPKRDPYTWVPVEAESFKEAREKAEAILPRAPEAAPSAPEPAPSPGLSIPAEPESLREISVPTGLLEEVWAQYGIDENAPPNVLRLAFAIARYRVSMGQWKDNPELDGTDGAHPAWWRGNDNGVTGTAFTVLKMFSEKMPHPGKFSLSELNDIRDSIHILRRRADMLQRCVGPLERLTASVDSVTSNMVREEMLPEIKKALPSPRANHANGHCLYVDGEDDAPASIKDRNGAIVLGLCRWCGAGEVQLDRLCTGEKRP